MRQRVALERALLHDPRLLLLDEPFTGLDQASTAALVARLRDRQQAGCLIVLATHDLDVADGLLTRALFLTDGRHASADAGSDGPLRERYRGRCQSHERFFRVAWLVVRKDLTVEVRSLEILSTTLFFAVTVVLMFSFGLVAKDGAARRCGGRRSCGSRSRSPARWRWAAPSSASARTTRCARCCWRRPIDRRSTPASCSGILLLLALVELVLVPLVGLLFRRRSSRSPAAAGAAGRRARSALPPSARCSPRCWCARAAATCCCRCCCIR